MRTRNTELELERFLSMFYAITDAPFLVGPDAVVTLVSCRNVLGAACVPTESTSEELAEQLQLPESSVVAVLQEMHTQETRASRAWSELIDAYKNFSSAPLGVDEALDRLLNES